MTAPAGLPGGAVVTATSRHRVAVIVFCEVEDAYADEAGYVARMAVTHALSGGEPGEHGYRRLRTPWPRRVGFVRPDGVEFTADVAQVMEVGAAAGNGYLWTTPTAKAFRESRSEHEDGQ